MSSNPTSTNTDFPFHHVTPYPIIINFSVQILSTPSQSSIHLVQHLVLVEYPNDFSIHQTSIIPQRDIYTSILPSSFLFFKHCISSTFIVQVSLLYNMTLQMFSLQILSSYSLAINT